MKKKLGLLCAQNATICQTLTLKFGFIPLHAVIQVVTLHTILNLCRTANFKIKKVEFEHVTPCQAYKQKGFFEFCIKVGSFKECAQAIENYANKKGFQFFMELPNGEQLDTAEIEFLKGYLK